MNGKRWLLLILVIYAVLGIAYSWIVPLGEAPDEVDHFLYVRYLVEQRAFPVMHPKASDNETMEANQPPLFYLLNAIATAPFPMAASADFPLNACFTFDPHDGGRAHFYLHQTAEQEPFAADYLAFRVARLLSVVLGAIAVCLVYGLGRQMMPSDERVSLLAAGILAFNPQFIFMTASVNNDVLTAVIGAALVYFSVEAVRTPSRKRFVVLGLLMGLGLLTKFALLAFWPLPLLAALLSIRNERWKSALQNGVIVVGLPILIAGWWYLRAIRLYGDPLAWDVHLQAKGSEVLRTSVLTLLDLQEFLVIHFQSYWAWFGWLKIQAPGWVYGLLAVGVLLATMGLILVLLDRRIQISRERIANLHTLIRNAPTITAVLFNGLAVAAIYASLLRYIQTINWSGYQGRLAYAAAAPIAALLGLGWWRLTTYLPINTRTQGSRANLAKGMITVLPVLGLLVLASASLVQLSEAFSRPTLFTPPSAWNRVCQVTPGGFYIEAVDFPATGLPGDSLTVLVAGYGSSQRVPAGEVALINWDGSLLDTAVSERSIFAFAKEMVLDTMVLTVPQDTLPTGARLVYFFDDQTFELGRIKIASTDIAIPSPSYPITANFADQIALIGYNLQIEADYLRLTTYWQALQPIPADYTIFVHVLDKDNVLVVQQDAQPQGERYPTSIWDVGEVVVDEAILPLPSDARPEQIAIGLYRLDTLGRLSLVGEVVGDMAVNQTDQILLKLVEN